MRTKEDLMAVITQIILGIICIANGWFMLTHSPKDYLGLWEIINICQMVGGWLLIFDGWHTIKSEVTNTPKESIFSIDDEEEL